MSDERGDSVRVRPLQDGEYETWNIRARSRLISKKCWDAIEPAITVPEDATEEEAEALLKAALVKRTKTKMAEAHAEIVNMLSDGQLVYAMDDDPRVVWQSLEEVHRSQGLSTQLALKRRMLGAVKDRQEPMLGWISRVKGMAATLRLLGAPISDLDTILALTGGLGAAYKTLILQLDGVPDSQLTLKYVVQRLINYDTIDHEGDITTAAALAANSAAGGGNGGGGNGGNGGAGGGANGGAGDGGGRTCYKCGRSGHIRKFCPDGQGGGSNAGATSGSGAGGTGNGTGAVAGYTFAF